MFRLTIDAQPRHYDGFFFTIQDETPMTAPIKKMIEEKWHAMSEKAVCRELETTRDGLTDDEAAQRLSQYGLNALPVKKPPALWQILLHQVLNPLIFILIAAAVASMAIGELTDAIFILLVIAINSGLGAYQEYNAEKSAASLQKMLKISARVLRSGSQKEISAEELVPGDIVFLESGNKVPADLRLLEANGLNADESFLTGESMAAVKKSDVLMESLRVADRANMAFAGATITGGRAMGVVVATGMATEVGKIAENISLSESAKPPLVLRMERFTRQLSVIAIALSAVLAGILWKQGMVPREIFFFVVALAVSAIPEGLPVALTVALSIATSRMSKRNVIVRKLTAVESLGSCTVIASDKTGTLTVNQQTVKIIEFPGGDRFRVSGEGYNGDGEVRPADDADFTENRRQQAAKIAKLSILANEGSLKKENGAWKYHGDAMDVAFLALGYKMGLDPETVRRDFSLAGTIPYESERKYSAAFYNKNGKVHVAAKGALETILGFCDDAMDGGGLTPLDPDAIETRALALAAEGYRVLAVAGGEFDHFETKDVYEDGDLPRLMFYGLVAFIDPLRPEAKDAVEKCRRAGITVLMITGDHPATAETIAREIGIADWGEAAVTGARLAEAGPADSPAFIKLVASSHVFARVSPVQKLEIVDALIRRGEFVAVTGDGVNDAPALRRANIGVAMGSGTDVAKEISSMIVTDDNFSSIVAGVEEGRYAYDNVRKVIYLAISTGAAEVMLFIAAIMTGLPLPLLAVQLLWLNLVTNGIQDVSLAFEGGEPGAMQRRPRRTDEKIFNPVMIQQTVVSGLTMGLITFAFWFFLIHFKHMDETHARDLVLLLMVFMQNFHVFNCRSETVSIFRIPLSRNWILLFGVMAAQGIHIAAMHIPFMQTVLRIEPITIGEWAEVLVLAVPMIMVMEIFKKIRAGRRQEK
jgi:magnesium-transporting ATPase (P-type)